jgi:pterin-4a-carbinolamine dehydratase
MTAIEDLRGIAALAPLRGHHPAATVRWLEMRCEECTQARVDMA